MDRAQTEQAYLQLVRESLPSRARERAWVLRLDHCFGRVLLDHAVGGCWYDALDRRRSAYRQLSDRYRAGSSALGVSTVAESSAVALPLSRS